MSISRREFLSASTLSVGGFLLTPSQMFGAVSSITVKTPFGPLVGQQSGTVNIFRGVPFAEPPVGPLRYKPTQPLRPWTRPREATQFSPAAMQPGGGGFKESEDCLYLNIWAPSGKGPFPVYIWIHGGGFTGGRAFDPLFDGTALAQQGTVCVTVAYRLGAFGFLDLEPMLGPEFASSANNALRDLIAAFDWVQKSISAFGGDPNQVTIGGESAGAKLTDILMGVPSARSLFHQMISESGGAERVFDIEKSKKVGEGFAKAWHTQTGLSPKALATAPARQIIEVQHNFTANWPWHFPLRCQIDGDLLPHKPVVAIQDGSSKDKRLLIGTNRDESALFVGPHPAHDATPADLGNLTQVQFDKVYEDYENLYPKMSVEMRRIRALTAEEYWVPSMRVAEAHLRGGGEAYVYRLDFAEAAGRLHGFAYHSLDLPLVWDKPHANAGNIADETKLAATMQQAWIEFLRGKAPAAPGLPAWPEYNLETRPTMILNVESQVEHEPQESELNLWKGIL